MRVYVKDNKCFCDSEAVYVDLKKLKYKGTTDKGYEVYDSEELTSWQVIGLSKEVLAGADIQDLCYRYAISEREFYKYVGDEYYFFKAQELRDQAQKLLDQAEIYDKMESMNEHKITK